MNIMDVYQNEIYPKALLYHQTNLVKSIKAQNRRIWDVDSGGYGIADGDVISIDKLIGIILYTDYTELSSNFSATFRSNSSYEPIEAIKARNAYYYWLSKELKETIAVYGQYHTNIYDKPGAVGLLDRLRGPFYCGMNWVMTMSQFNIQLFSPTSTTKHKEIATRFGGESGMIITFDNSKGNGRFVRGFDVSWISRYGPQEDERYEIYIIFYILLLFNNIFIII